MVIQTSFVSHFYVQPLDVEFDFGIWTANKIWKQPCLSTIVAVNL